MSLPPHLVSLVLQSKKALQNGEQLCSRAHAVSNASAHISVDVVALDAKVRWVTDAVGEQLKLVANVAKSIEEKRVHLKKQVQAWDILRSKHSNVLDNILESLESQLVPPDFYQSTSADLSPFGSQHSDEDPQFAAAGISGELKQNGKAVSPVDHSPSSTLRNGLHVDKQTAKHREKQKSNPRTDRKSWKTLRDFVDDQAIEDVLETIESDRLELEDIMSKTDEYPETLAATINSIQESLPDLAIPPMKAVEEVLTAQDVISTSMAAHLESLTSHYGQMSTALQESEAGEVFSDEDLHDMNRDMNELPSIVAELEESVDAIEMHHGKLYSAQESSQAHISLLVHTLDDLDELGDIMAEMLKTQDEVQVNCEEQLNGLHNHLLTLEHLRSRFISYQTAFNKLILELARRRQYREAAENIVRGMMAQLEAMSEEENQVRSHFNSGYGEHLPEDICLCIGNTPTRWEISPWNGDDGWEFLPIIEDDLITRAQDHIAASAEQEDPPGGSGPESL